MAMFGPKCPNCWERLPCKCGYSPETEDLRETISDLKCEVVMLTAEIRLLKRQNKILRNKLNRR